MQSTLHNFTTRRLATLMAFATAMGLLETAVVIYLRELYYPEGFRFPLVPIPQRLAMIEVLREAATVIMLITVGHLAGFNKLQRFASFCIAFAVWDLVYYLLLYVLIGWPASLLTWDILFLIPVPWVGPVWAPCLISLLMLVSSICMIRKQQARPHYIIYPWQWLLLLSGALVSILSFMLDYFSAASQAELSQPDLFSDLQNYVPQEFNCYVFFTGFIMMLSAVIINLSFTNKNKSHEKA
jgi:hypothetical protein